MINCLNKKHIRKNMKMSAKVKETKMNAENGNIELMDI